MREIFWEAFDGAEQDGEPTIKTIANILFLRWRDHIQELTDLIMVINHKSWDHFSKHNDELCNIYTELYYKYYEKSITYLENNNMDEELSYFIRTLD